MAALPSEYTGPTVARIAAQAVQRYLDIISRVHRDDANDSGLRLPGIRAQYEEARQPKQLIVVDGSAHAQFLFQTDKGARVMHEILRFLSVP